MTSHSSFSIPPLLLTTAFQIDLSNAFPVSLEGTPFNSTEQQVGWISAPNYRDTLSIITSCVITMGICVW
jgi:hypothetical protein